jgi:hypothetical protein
MYSGLRIMDFEKAGTHPFFVLNPAWKSYSK